MSTPDTKQVKRRVHRLEKRLTHVREVQEKRSRQAERAQARGGARKAVAKRTRQLEKATRRAATLEAALVALGTAAGGPSAYCLRERTVVAMRKPQPMLMRNGRAALAGTCPSCGARVVRPA